MNEELGEFWYKLNLIAAPAPPVLLQQMVCSVGTHCNKQIRLENPTGADLVLKGSSSNKLNFSVVPTQVQLKPYATEMANVRYTPSSLDPLLSEEGTVTFSNQTVGEWVYKVSGHGLPPSTAMDPVVVTSSVGHSTSSSFIFRNPFPKPLSVAVQMLFEPTRTGSFQLLLKKSKTTITPFGKLQIPFIFAPMAIVELKAIVEIESIDNAYPDLKWVYPLQGIAETLPFSPKIELSCRARQSIDRQIEIRLPGLEPFEQPEKFTYSLKVSDENTLLVHSALSISPINEVLFQNDEPLRYHVKFEPLRAFREPGELIINKKSGGRWRFKLLLEVLDPDVDDVIVCEATLNQTSSVSFDLANIDSQPAEFKAFFTPDSPFEFSVYPTEGVLEPYGRAGTNFVLSFTPRDYGKILVGKLVIQTKEMMWSYEVRGTHPSYSKPRGTSKIGSTSPKARSPKSHSPKGRRR